MGARFGNYEIIRKLGAGGMAEVFLAKQVGIAGFERLVCLKRILSHLSEQDDFLQMFRDEARIAAQLAHPSIVQIYEINQVDGAYYIAMEYVRGEDLRKVYNQEIKRGQAIAPTIAAHIVMGAASGLAYAHRQNDIHGRPLGIVHRDISPQNILVSYDGHVKIVDFGVAKAAGKMAHTRSGVLKGKYSYMSPEQAAGDPVDGRSDIFALGTTLYEVTTGTRLFKRDNELETLHAVIACKFKPPSKVVANYDSELESIVMRALAYEADARYQTAAELERELDSYLRLRGYSTHALTLSDYMHELFADKLADEALFAGEPWDESNTQTPERSRVDQPEQKFHDNKQPGFEPTVIGGQPPVIETTEIVDLSAESKHVDMPHERSKTIRKMKLDDPTETSEPSAGSSVSRAETAHNAFEMPWDGEEGTASREMTRAMEVLRPTVRLDAPVTETPPIVPDVDIVPPKKSRRAMWILGAVTFAVITVFASFIGMDKRISKKRRHIAEPAPQQAAEVVPNPAPPIAVPEHAAQLTVLAPIRLDVWSGDKRLGETPLINLPIEPGLHRLRLESGAEGYQSYRKVTLRAEERLTVEVDSQPGKLLVTAAPWAWVKIGQKSATETPVETELFDGEYAVLTECPDGARKRHVVSMRAGEVSKIELDCK